MASAITLDINTSQISSIDSAQRILLSLTKGTSKTVYIIFFILKGHFCPPCPSQQKARGAAAPLAPPVPASLLQILNISRVIMSEMWDIGRFKNPRKMFLLHILITYTKQYNRTIKRRRKPMKGCLLFRVKSWFYPNMVYSLLNFSVCNRFFCLKLWKCSENAVNNIFLQFLKIVKF